MPPHVAAAARANRYNARVLLAPYWNEVFAQDTERKQTRAEAEATCAVMRETYAALESEIIELPCADMTASQNGLLRFHLGTLMPSGERSQHQSPRGYSTS